MNKIIDAAKKKIEWNSFVNATDILAKQSAAVPISTGSSDLDELLGGGIQTGYLTEIYGEAGGTFNLLHDLNQLRLNTYTNFLFFYLIIFFIVTFFIVIFFIVLG